MEKQSQVDIHFALFAGILLFTILSISVLLFFILYKRRLFRKQAEMLQLESQHKEDLLFSSIVSAENERKRIAADIHDELGSIFVTLSYSINKIEDRDSALLQVNLKNSKGLIEKGLNSVRKISHTIMPPELELYGLLFTLENFCQKLNTAGTGVEVDFDTSIDRFDQPAATGLALYRVLQELTTNTLRHAGASAIRVRLDANEKEYIMRYTDDGAGFDSSAIQARSGLGFKNIESRIRMINGKINYTTSPGNGFSCEIIIPGKQIIPI